jgi:hypothetical protein
MEVVMRTKGLIAPTCIVAACALSSFALVPDGFARDVGALGGGGGAEFRQNCRPNDVIIGFRFQSGTALDSITALCAGLNPERTRVVTESYSGREYGGLGGKPQFLLCKGHHAVRHLHVYMDNNKIVNHFRFTCQRLGSGEWHDAVPANIGGRSVGDVRFSCGEGEWATGIYGRYGALVDQLGLQCDKIAAEAGPQSLPDVITRDKVPPTDVITKPKPTEPAPLPDPGPKLTACAVLLDTDIFSACQGNQTGAFLAANTQGVTLLNRCAADANWFNVKWPAGQGWVFSGPGHLSLDCK